MTGQCGLLIARPARTEHRPKPRNRLRSMYNQAVGPRNRSRESLFNGTAGVELTSLAISLFVVISRR